MMLHGQSEMRGAMVDVVLGAAKFAEAIHVAAALRFGNECDRFLRKCIGRVLARTQRCMPHVIGWHPTFDDMVACRGVCVKCGHVVNDVDVMLSQLKVRKRRKRKRGRRWRR